MSLFFQFLLDAILLGGFYALMAVGLALGLGVTRITNFTHGEFIMFGAYAAFFAVGFWGIDPILILPLIAIIVAFFGAGLFKLVARRALAAPRINQILLMFGISLVLQNLAVLAFTGNPRSVSTSYSLDATEFSDVWIPHGRVVTFMVAAALIVGLIVWLKRSELGRATMAVAQNEKAATLMGINVNFIYLLAFGINAGLAGASGVAISFLLTITPFMGFHMLVKGFAIVILGGLGSIWGAVIGAFLLALAETGVSYYVPNGIGWAEGVAFVVLLIVLIIRPRGILGQKFEEAH
jgi:branched-chain amino acid transport system permease protein